MALLRARWSWGETPAVVGIGSRRNETAAAQRSSRLAEGRSCCAKSVWMRIRSLCLMLENGGPFCRSDGEAEVTIFFQ